MICNLQISSSQPWPQLSMEIREHRKHLVETRYTLQPGHTRHEDVIFGFTIMCITLHELDRQLLLATIAYIAILYIDNSEQRRQWISFDCRCNLFMTMKQGWKMTSKNLGFQVFFKKTLKNLKSPKFRFLKFFWSKFMQLILNLMC